MSTRYIFDADGMPIGEITGYGPDGEPQIIDWLDQDLGPCDPADEDEDWFADVLSPWTRSEGPPDDDHTV